MAAYRALDHKAFFQSEDTVSDSSLPGRRTARSSEATTETMISSSLSSSPWSTTLSPAALQQAVHVTTRPGDPSLSLRLCSRAPSASSIPILYGGDVIKGDVMLSVVPQEAQYITSVEIELRGVTYVVGSVTPHGFLSVRSTLWTDTTCPDMPQKNGAKLAGKESTGHPHDVQLFSVSRGQSRSSSNSPYYAFRSAIKSMARSMKYQLNGDKPSHTTIPTTQLNKPRRRLEAPRPHVWPFELSLPTCMVLEKRMISVAFDSASSSTPQVHYSKFHPETLGVRSNESPEAEGEKGGIWAEKAGYGVGWDEGDGSGGSRQEDTMNQSATGNVLKRSHSMGTLQSEDGRNLSPSAVEQSVLLSIDDRHTFMLPPSFSEPSGVACLQYKIVVTVHRRGALRGNWSLQQKLHVPHYSYTEHSARLPLRAIHPPVIASQLPGPLEHPRGWNLMPEVVLQLQPKISPPSKGHTVNLITKEVVLKLALSRPLCYACGTTIPFRITISIPHPCSSPSQSTLKLSRRRKFNVSSTLASHTTLFSPSFALSVAPLFHRSRATATSKAILSQVTERVPSRRFATASQGSQDESEVSLVPLTSSIATSIRLVRAIHVGPDANDDRGIRRESESFLQTISTAVILDNNAAESDMETDVTFKGWTTEGGRLVRTFVGEIPLKSDIKPSFVFPHFVVKYAVVLFPFEACGLVPSSRDPLWSEPVSITARPARAESSKDSETIRDVG